MSSRWRYFAVHCMGLGICQSLAGISGLLAFFLGIQVCWRTGGDMHLTSGAVHCRVLESLV